MIEDLGESGRLALTFARLTAVEVRAPAVGTEHLFLGVAELEDATIRDQFTVVGVDLGLVCARIRKVYPNLSEPTPDRLPFTPAAERALEAARRQAVQLGGELVEAPHILIGVIEAEDDPVAREIQYHAGGDSTALALLEMQLRRMLLESRWSPDFYRERTAIEQPEIARTSKVLESLGRNLTSSARRGELNPIIGRDRELLQLVQVLCGSRKRNAVVVGEAGVGKTAIVEGLAQRIVDHHVPEQLAGMEVRTIEIGSLVAGTQYRGQFEAKLEALIAEVRDRADLVLFIDEMHMLVGAGRAEGIVMDAADMLKPVLTEGTLKVIGATTTAEFRRYIETDEALMRRFQPVVVGEPSREDALTILEGLRPRYAHFHGVEILDEALEAAVDLSVRYLTDRYLPDKALDLLDRACTQEKLGAGMRHWMPSLAPPAEERTLDLVVDAQGVAEVVSMMREIPIAALRPDERKRLREMGSELKKRVIGQDDAVDAVANAILAAHVMREPQPERPYGVFVFLGPSGVGKTRLAEELAAYLFGSRDELIRLDMAEYTEPYAVSSLVGTAPGYAGWEEGGMLTNAVRGRPYSVVLLDDIEKAHPSVLELLEQVFDQGTIRDRAGRRVDFRSAVIVMTSSLGAGPARPVGFGIDGGEDLQPDRELRKLLGEELLNRIDEQVVFKPLSKTSLRAIIELLLEEMIPMKLELSDDALDLLVEEGYDRGLGARPLRRTIQRMVRNPLSLMVANGEIGEDGTVAIDVRRGELVFTGATDVAVS